MNANEIIEAAKCANVSLSIAVSGNVSATGRRFDVEQLLPVIQQNKAAVLRELRQVAKKWTPYDWQEYFDERAGLAEFGGGLSRDEAEARAFSCCVGEWLYQNPVRSPRGECAYCDQSKGRALPYLTGYAMQNPGHTWLHSECSDAWHLERKNDAINSLNRMGITIADKQV